MPSPRLLAISTLRCLSRQCLHEQMRLRDLRAIKRQIQRDEAATYRRIKGIKRRIDRELTVSAELLGLPKPPAD